VALIQPKEVSVARSPPASSSVTRAPRRGKLEGDGAADYAGPDDHRAIARARHP